MISFGKLAMVTAVLILEIYSGIGRIIQKIPFALWITGKPALWKCVSYYVVLFLLLWMKKVKDGKNFLWNIGIIYISFMWKTSVGKKRYYIFRCRTRGMCLYSYG